MKTIIIETPDSDAPVGELRLVQGFPVRRLPKALFQDDDGKFWLADNWKETSEGDVPEGDLRLVDLVPAVGWWLEANAAWEDGDDDGNGAYAMGAELFEACLDALSPKRRPRLDLRDHIYSIPAYNHADRN